MSEIRVYCYSGYRVDQRPSRFTIRDREYNVQELDDQWYSPDATYFRVRADDGNYYVLRHDEGQDSWTLDGYRQALMQSCERSVVSNVRENPTKFCFKPRCLSSQTDSQLLPKHFDALRSLLLQRREGTYKKILPSIRSFRD